MTNRNIFFVHVMKTGGTSLARALQSLYDVGSTYPDFGGHRQTIPQKTMVRALLDKSAAERESYQLLSAHLPAWVATELLPDHLSVTILRDPVERAISHLRQVANIESTDVETIYGDTTWRPVLSNYQTRIFSMTRADYDHQVRSMVALDPVEVDRLSESDVDSTWRRAFASGIEHPAALEADALDRARAQLELIDEVGVTHRLTDLARRIGDHLGVAVPEVSHDNRSATGSTISPELRRQIADDNELDLELYEYVQPRV